MDIDWIVEGLRRQGKTKSGLAAAMRVRNSAISDLLAGRRKLQAAEIGPAAAYLEVSAPTLLELAPSPKEGYRAPPQFLGDRDLPVFAAVEGGPGEMVVNTDPIEWVQRPWFMREVKDGYAVVVTGESMIPVYEPGDMVIVNPRLPAIRNKNAIFVGGEDRGEFRATVKRLERSTVKEWHVKQWNPPDGGSQELVLNKAQWPKALRIVGKYEGG